MLRLKLKVRVTAGSSASRCVTADIGTPWDVDRRDGVVQDDGTRGRIL
jgi:hypothetical protein